MVISIYGPLIWVAGVALGGAVLLIGVWVYCQTLSRQARAALVCAFPEAGVLLKSEAREQTRRFFRNRPRSAGATESDDDGIPGQVDLDTIDVRSLAATPLARGAPVTAFAKSLIDLVASLSLIFFMLPLILITAIAVKLDSRGPVFYRQVRVGRDGQKFSILKFRSMSVDAEKDGPCWARENDCRVTRIGTFLRRSRIDEIPQAFNVLAGQMSFVGPRPERPEFVTQLKEQVPHFDERHSVKPGITGWAQVNYPYGASVKDAKRKLQYDLYYIRNYSVLLDILIIIKTIRVAITGIGSR